MLQKVNLRMIFLEFIEFSRNYAYEFPVIQFLNQIIANIVNIHVAGAVWLNVCLAVAKQKTRLWEVSSLANFLCQGPQHLCKTPLGMQRVINIK